MNKVLLAKWIARLDRGEDSVCIKLLCRKYLGEKNFMQQKHIRGASQFWQGLWKVGGWYKKGRGWKLGNGRQISFWEDVWLEECLLRVKFPAVYRICLDERISVAEASEKG